MSGISGEGLSPELTTYIDNLGTDEIPGMTEDALIAFRFAYGSIEQHDELEEVINEQLALHTEGYTEDLNIFLSASPDDGLPSFVYYGRHGEPQHEESRQELNVWLKLAKEHLPGAENEAMAAIVTFIDDRFDADRFEASIATVSDPLKRYEAEDAMHYHAGELAYATTSQLCEFADNAEVIQQYIDSAFMQVFGSEEDLATLQHRALELQGTSASYTYVEVVTNAAKKVTGEQAASNITTYNEFMESHFREAGTVDAVHVDQLKALVKAGHIPNTWGYKVLYANMPVDEVAALVEQRPGSLRDTGVRAICVRRFATEGHLEKAYELARTEMIADSRQSVLEPIHNLLAIYEETGDESAYIEAIQRFQAAQSNEMPMRPGDYNTHSYLARVFAAASKQGHAARTQQALAAMEPFYSEKSYGIQDSSLRTILRVSLDQGNLPAAEDYAVRLKKIRDKRFAHDGQESTEGLLHVVRAYMQAGDSQAATRVVQTYFATERPVYALKTAITLLHGEKPEYMPQLHTDHFDEVTVLTAKK